MTIPRKIGVLTFHRCINYGSYWQARCLIEGLRGMGHEAVLLDHYSPAINRREWRCALDPLLPTKSSVFDRLQYAVKTRRFLNALEALPRSARFELDDPSSLGRWDLVIVGSDEVWNGRHPWYGGHALFYGHGVQAVRLVAYAASFGSQSASDYLPSALVEGLRTFSCISVRDANSVALAANVLGQRPETVLDPCLLFPPLLGRPQSSAGDPYIAVYGHGFSAGFAQAIRDFAHATGHRLVSIGYRNSWTHEQFLQADPGDFARALASATAVVTNFFHGCVFALINKKPFACETSSYRANKVTDLLALLSADAHLITERSNYTQVQSLLQTPLEPEISGRLHSLRARSQRFLERALEP
jgi:hypothetical protein